MVQKMVLDADKTSLKISGNRYRLQKLISEKDRSKWRYK